MEEAEKIKRAYALKELNELPAWSHVEDIFVELYLISFDKLKDKEDEVARATMNALDDIYAKIKNGIKVGELAKEKFKNKYKGVK